MSEQNEMKVHYQNLKAKCLEMALALNPASTDSDDDEAVVVAAAKRFYNEITGQNWTGEDVPGA